MLKRGDSGFLEELRKQLYTAVLSDVLDETGFRDQAMAARVRPLDDELVMAGFARTGLFREVFHVAEGENPYELEIRIIDDLKSGEIVVFGCGGSERIAPCGELLTTAASARGAVGAVTDGFVRDVRAIRNAGFSVFHGGIAPLDSKGRGKVADIDVPIVCAGVRVSPATSSSAMSTGSWWCRERSKRRSWRGPSRRSAARTPRATSSCAAPS
jgi:4-hydroxy-4-methyl-2-oxoglutarate aldolase